MNPHLSVVSQTFVMVGVNLREIGVISVTVMNFPQEFETNICVNTILPASTVKRETLIHFFCQVLKFKAVKFRLTRMHSSRMRTARSRSLLLGRVSASVHAGIHPQRCGPGDPPGQTPQLPPWVWAWRPPPPGRPLNLPLWVWAWRPAMHAGIPPPPPVDRQTRVKT